MRRDRGARAALGCVACVCGLISPRGAGERGGVLNLSESSNQAAVGGVVRPLRLRLVALGLALAAGAAYHNTLHAPFVLDDFVAIQDNASLRSLWPLGGPLSPPPGGLPVSGRPLANLTLAINHAISGDSVWSYHVGNFALHVLTGLVLFVVLRRTLACHVVAERFRRDAELIAVAVAALWVLHPLATAAVTYTSQRTEIMAALCYLLVLQAVGRAAEAGRWARWWGIAAVAACAAGMASKETMASAPVIALLYDRTFFAGSFAGAWRARWRLHLGLMSGWVLLAYLVIGTAGRGGTAGFGLDVTPLRYAATQALAITRYLGLAFWPHPLVFDYGMYLARGAAVLVPSVVVVGGLVGTTLVALVRRPVSGFGGAIFFAVLAPSSSFVPVATQTMAEHRMYLPLGVILTFAVAGLWAWLGRRSLPVLALVIVIAGGLTVARNRDYATEEGLWRATVRHWPNSARAYNNLASVLLERGETAAGMAELQRALQVDPYYTDALCNLSRAEAQAGKVDSALARAEEARRLTPGSAAVWSVVGSARLLAGQRAEAEVAWREAVRLRPAWPEAHFSLGHVLLANGKADAAAAEYGEALRLRPGWGAAHGALAGALNDAGRAGEALPHAQEAVRLEPDSAQACFNLGNSLFQLDRAAEALTAYRAALRVRSDFPGVNFNYGNALLAAGQAADALAQFDEALRHEGRSAALACSRALALFELGRIREGAAAVDEALRLDPDYGPALALREQLAKSNQ